MKKSTLLLLAALTGCADGPTVASDAAPDRRIAMDAASDGSSTRDAAMEASADAASIDAVNDVRDAGVSADADAALSCGAGPRDCEPGDGTGEGDQCFAATSCFLRSVQSAIRVVVDGNPAWFDASMGGSPRVLNEPGYMNGVVMELRNRGLCAIIDPNAGDEIVVKHERAVRELRHLDRGQPRAIGRRDLHVHVRSCWF